MRRFSWLATCVFLAACQPGTMGKVTSGPPPNPIAGAEITTTTLDTAAAVEAPLTPADAPDLRKPLGGTVDASNISGTAAAQADGVIAVPATEVDIPAEAESETADTPVADAPVVEEPVLEKSADQLRCEARGGVFAAAEDSGARACVRQTRDGGKHCEQESDCDGQCLARSQTCAPINPLLGCNEVLQQNGAAVTLCLN